MAILILITLLCAALLIAGLIGCIVPGIPGPQLAFVSLIILSLYSSWTLYSALLLILTAALTLITMLLDYVLPIVSVKKTGADKKVIWGCMAGLIIGLIFFPPFGAVIGAFLGALLFELIFNPKNKTPLKSAFAVLFGTFLSVILKLSVTGFIAFYVITGIIRLYEQPLI